jgi:hypothetical protein
LEAYKKRFGCYPKSVIADKIYRTRENRAYCKAHGIRLSGPALGRPAQGEEGADRRRMARQDTSERNAIEGKFGEGKRKYGLGLIRARLAKTSEAVIVLQLLVMNLGRRLRDLFVRLIRRLLDLVRQIFCLFASLKESFSKPYIPAILAHKRSPWQTGLSIVTVGELIGKQIGSMESRQVEGISGTTCSGIRYQNFVWPGPAFQQPDLVLCASRKTTTRDAQKKFLLFRQALISDYPVVVTNHSKGYIFDVKTAGYELAALQPIPYFLLHDAKKGQKMQFLYKKHASSDGNKMV